MTPLHRGHAVADPFRPEGLGQRLAPFVAAGSLAALLVFGTDVTRLGLPSTLTLAVSLLLTASVYHPIWDRLPRATEAVPLAGATVAVLSGSSAVTGVRQGVILAVLAAALLGGFFLPWHKLPRLAQALPPWAAIGVLFVAHLVGGATSVAVFPFILLVILWLALYHSVAELVVGMVMSVLLFLTPAPGSAHAADLGDGVLYASVSVLIGFSVAHLLNRLRRQAVDARNVELMMRRISAEDPAAARTALCTGALQIGDATAAILFELEADGALVPSAAAPGAPPAVRLSLDGRIMTKRGEPLDNARHAYPSVEAFLTGRPVFRADLSGLPRPVQDLGGVSETRSILSQPVLREGNPVGVLTLSWDRPVRRLPERIATNAGLFAAQAGFVLLQADNLRKVTASEERLARIAATDPLTGLANRREFDARLEKTGHRRFAVIAIDVDNLKETNDAYGHEAGDASLQAAAHVLAATVRDGDVVARTGGDEFTALLPGATLEEAKGVAERMRTGMHGVTLRSGMVRISAGCAAGFSQAVPRDVLIAADTALYQAKESGKDRVESRHVGSGPLLSTRLASQGRVLEALVKGQVHSVYQPIVRLEDGTVIGFEALARPDGSGPTASGENLFAASHQLGLDRDIDWICRRAAVHGAHNLPSGPALFINVGVAALLDPLHDVDQMLLLLRWAQRTPEHVVLEITEREPVRDMDRFEKVLAEYRSEGFRFALDDVGEGHSTFEVLAAAVPEFIKISARFARPGRRPGPHSAIRAAVAFAENTGAEVIAEGLEQADNVELARSLGVTLGQGHALGKPALVWGDVEITGATPELHLRALGRGRVRLAGSPLSRLPDQAPPRRRSSGGRRRG
ncbi:MAG: EAL domain-containing protein [Chloroflexi bacterium]|nr:MAG: EAL domain-containing protein [Chloroflexota bacterium]